MSSPGDVKDTGSFVPLQHWDDEFDLGLRRVPHHCRLVREEETGRLTIEPGSQGDGVGAVLWHAREGLRTNSAGNNLSAWFAAAASSIVAEAPVSLSNDSTRTRATADEAGPLILPDFGNGIPDSRFVPKRVEVSRPSWASKSPKGWTGTLTGGISADAQGETWHPDFLAIVSASRNARGDYSSMVVDLNADGEPDDRHAAPFHTLGVVETIKNVGPGKLAPGPIVARPLNDMGDGANSGGSYVYDQGGGADRTLLPMSWEDGGPLTWSDPTKHQTGTTTSGRIMPAAISSSALYRYSLGGVDYSGPHACGPLPFRGIDAILNRDAYGLNAEGWICWDPDQAYAWIGGAERGAYRILVESPIQKATWQPAPAPAPGTTRERPVIRSQGGGRLNPQVTNDPNYTSDDFGKDLPSAKDPQGNPRGPGGVPGLPGLNDGLAGRGGAGGGHGARRNPLGGFGIPSSGEQSHRNRPRNPLGGFGIPGGGGGGGDDGPPIHTQHGRSGVQDTLDEAARENKILDKAEAKAARLEKLAKRYDKQKGRENDAARMRKAAEKARNDAKNKIRERQNKKEAKKNRKKKENYKRTTKNKRAKKGPWKTIVKPGGILDRRSVNIRGKVTFISAGGSGGMSPAPPTNAQEGAVPDTHYRLGQDLAVDAYLDFAAKAWGAGATNTGWAAAGGDPSPLTGRLVGYGANAEGLSSTHDYTGGGGGPRKSTAGGIMILPACGTVAQALDGELEGTTYLTMPSDASGARWGTPTSDGEVVSGLQMAYYDGTGFGITPINSSGTLAAGGFEISITSEQITIHGSAGTTYIEGNLHVGGKGQFDGRLDPTTLEITDTASNAIPNTSQGFRFDSATSSSRPLWTYGSGSTTEQIAFMSDVSGVSATGLPTNYIQGLQVHVLDSGDDLALVEPGSCRNEADDDDLVITSQLTADVTLKAHGTGGRVQIGGIDAPNLTLQSSGSTCSQTGTTITSVASIVDSTVGRSYESFTPKTADSASTTGTTFTAAAGSRLDESIFPGDLIGHKTTYGWSRVVSVDSPTQCTLVAALPGGNMPASTTWSIIHNPTVAVEGSVSQRINTIAAGGKTIVGSVSYTAAAGSELVLGDVPFEAPIWLAVWLLEANGTNMLLLSTQHVSPIDVVSASPDNPRDNKRFLGWVYYQDDAGVMTGLAATRYEGTGPRRRCEIEGAGGSLITTFTASVTASWADVLVPLVPRTASHALASLRARNTASAIHGTHVTRTASGTLTNSTKTTINWDSELADIGGWHDNTTNNSRITVDRDDWYTVHANLYQALGGTTGSLALYVSVNGSDVALHRIPNESGENFYAEVNWQGSLQAGDYVEIKAIQTTGASRTVAGTNEYEANFSVIALTPQKASADREIYFRARQHGDSTVYRALQLRVGAGAAVADCLELPVDGASYIDTAVDTASAITCAGECYGWIDDLRQPEATLA